MDLEYTNRIGTIIIDTKLLTRSISEIVRYNDFGLEKVNIVNKKINLYLNYGLSKIKDFQAEVLTKVRNIEKAICYDFNISFVYIYLLCKNGK
jgi:hypothetical protein